MRILDLTLELATPPPTPGLSQKEPRKRPRLNPAAETPHHYICRCGKPAHEYLCRNSSVDAARVGKHYYKCATLKCKFWAWEGDSIPSRPASKPASRTVPIKCHCGEVALLLTSRHGMEHNIGRQFYKCRNQGKKGKIGCDFWIWADGSLPFSETSQRRFNDWMDGQ
jgi:hypothetical protein